MEENNYLRGSEWNIWDLQVQTILDNRYESIEEYYNTLKTNDSEKWESFTNLVGGEKNALLYDSKAYFNKTSIDKKERCTNYVRNLFSFLDVYNPKLKVVGFTDHNYYDDQLIDVLIEYSKKNSCKSLAGVEINVSGVHILVYFQKPPYKKLTFSEGIKTFLSKIEIDHPLTNGVLTLTTKSINEVVQEIISQNGIFIYAHCNSDNGLFQERAKTDRTYLADIYNKKNKILLQGISKINVDKTNEYIQSNNRLSSLPIFTIASNARSLKEICKSDNEGNYQWIKSNPTFDGLKQILFEPKERIFIGNEPKLLKKMREKKTYYIDSIKIDQNNGYNEEKGIWFKDVNIPLNPGLCAIIGNRGQGKSAIADILGLCGNSHRYNDFSFITEERFLKDGLAENFYAEINWNSNENYRKNISDNVDKNSPERVRYIPQNFFEILTNNLESYEFEKTIEDIVFSYLPEEQRLGKRSFEELIDFKKKNIRQNIDPILEKIHKLNSKIISLEKKAHPNNIELLKNKLKLKIVELSEHEKIKPKEVQNPSSVPEENEEQSKLGEKLNELNEQLDSLNIKKHDEEVKLESLSIEVIELSNLINDMEGLEGYIKNFSEERLEIFKKYDLNLSDILKYEVKIDLIQEKLNTKQSELEVCKELLLGEEEIHLITASIKKRRIENNNLNILIKSVRIEIEKITTKISEPQKKYQKYIEELKEWENRKAELEGSQDKINSKNWIEKELNYIEKDLPNELKLERKERINQSILIFNFKNELLKIFNAIKNKIDNEISKYSEFLGVYEISIEATLKLEVKFYDKYLSFINQRNNGSFKGKDEGKQILQALIKSNKFDNKNSVEKALEELIKYLEVDQREKYTNEKRNIKDQILEENTWEEFYNYIFSLEYLDSFYELKLGNKNLSQLSPGEKGALLIVFYLLLDKEDIPLIIDQPEENLDNESIYKILTHFLKITKDKRQVIIVTHNPNLAIVGDAEQIIFVLTQIFTVNKSTYLKNMKHQKN